MPEHSDIIRTKIEIVQMEKGMYGGIVIEDPTDPVVDNERVLVMDDMKLTSQNEFKQHSAVGRWIERHDGREGSTNLVNEKEALTMNMHAGQIERWRIVNAASARYFTLSLDGKPFKVIATDGGLLEYARMETEFMDHPFHLHGFFFQVLEENGKAPEYKAWKDTYNLKPRTRIKIAWMPDNRPGKWMYHCHIIEHHAAGMMANFEVIDPSQPQTEKQESFHGCHTK